MLGTQRQNEIKKLLNKKGTVTVADLVERFSVSIETVRRDLLTMEKKKLLTRVHGGAVSNAEMKPFHSLKDRNEENVEGKKELAKKACEFINDGDYIAVDAGSTATFLAEEIKNYGKQITVVTYSLDVFEILKNSENVQVILTGGFFKSGENAFYGNLVIDMLQRLHVQKAFIFPTAVSLGFGIGDYQSEFCMVQKELFNISDKIFILADSSKFEKMSLLKVEDMKAEFCFITDSGISDDLVSLYKENGIEIIKGEGIK